MKKIVHIVSHTHWDREWYLPPENHRMRLVNLMDGVIEASKDNKFINFQLDGHYLPIEDYLEVRPEKREKVFELVKEGKIKVGPWFILQDAFLTSGESNVRNLEIGIRKTRELTEPAMIGYFPDTFGNIGQAPQILKKAGINNAYFGRGVKATGLANVVIEDFTSKNSELIWKSPDGSEVIGVLFANWYCNGVDIPFETDLLKKYMDKKIEDMEKYASTNHLLLMNGCDHSPVQKNIGEIIEKLNSMYPEYEFIHSDLETYANEVANAVNRDGLAKIEGELRSQTTDGYWTLQGTSSSRYDLKKYNKNIEMRIEEVIQPLYSLFIDKELYPHEKLDYIYRKLITNHTHDAICGCSVDEVHDLNIRRFKDCVEGLDYLEDEAKIYLKNNIQTNLKDDLVFTVLNTSAYKLNKLVKIKLDFEKKYFSGFEYRRYIEELKALDIPNFEVYDKNSTYKSSIKDLGVNFGFDLPETSFRKPYFARNIEVEFLVDLEPFERREFALRKVDTISEEKNIDGNRVETDNLIIEILDNASVNITDKRIDRQYKNVLMIEDSGDIGNEYIYTPSRDFDPIKSSELIKSEIKELSNGLIEIELTEKLRLPISAEELLLDEQRYLVDLPERKSKRSSEYKDVEIKKTLRIEKKSSLIHANIELNNEIKDHRMRVLFGHKLDTDIVHAESIFEVAKRPTDAPKTWENPDYSQNLNRYISMTDEKGGFSVSTMGVQEYENKDEGLYLTLFRSTGQLGDWGYFPTEDSQMLTKLSFDLYIDYFNDNYIESWQKVLAARIPYVATQINKDNKEDNVKSKIDFDIKESIFSTVYINQEGEKIMRVYNPDGKAREIGNIDAKLYDILGFNEYKDDNYKNNELNPFEIRTLKLED